MALREWFGGRVFRYLHGNNLVYNACWEDPRVDRRAMRLGPADRVLVITSAGCNAIDYVLGGAGEVHAVDMNPRQNALLELKLAAAKTLEFEDYFEMFGRGRLPRAEAIYRSAIRPLLAEWPRGYWDRWIRFFDNPRRSFYYRGTSGSFARAIGVYIDRIARIRHEVMDLLAAANVAEQAAIYTAISRKLWSRTLKFVMDRDTTFSMLGVPKAQRRQIDRQYPGGVVRFVQDCMEAVFARLPIADNYFWRVYITGEYTRQCCPEYLTEAGWKSLRGGATEKLRIHTDSVQGFLDRSRDRFTNFVLLDHMDWLSDRFFPALEAEWQAIAARASEGARILWRSGGLRTDFLEHVTVKVGRERIRLPDALRLDTELAARLHQVDRVHTYGSFYVADFLPAAS